MTFDYKKILPHLIVVLIFIIASLAYFSPVLKGKVMRQGDIIQYKGMSHQLWDFRKQHPGKKTFWMQNAFGGMPTYTVSRSNLPHNFLTDIYKVINFLPKPANHLFLFFVGLYILFLVMKVDYKLATIGALAIGLSTWFVILLGVGHITKAQAIAYMPVVIAGVLSMFKRKYFWGGIILMIGLSLEIYAYHYQITYYLLYIVIIIGLVHLYSAIKNKQLSTFFKSVGLMLIPVALAVAANGMNLITTSRYADFSMRSPTGLTINSEGEGTTKKSTGMSYDYITTFSYGISETMNLFIPDFVGGASVEALGKDSHTFKFLTQQKGVSAFRAQKFLQHAPTYWGDQPYVAAPSYIGATIIFLFILALFLVRERRLKTWVVIACIVGIILSWGRHVEPITRFFIDYVPFYDKFRAVSMIQVIPDMLVPFFGFYGLSKLFSDKLNRKTKLYALKWATIIAGGICVFFLLFKTLLFDFSGRLDMRYVKMVGPGFIEALKQDRIAMFNASTIRTLVFVLFSAGFIWAYISRKIRKRWLIGALILLVVVDLVGVDRDYVNNDDFEVKMANASKPFVPNAADKQIMKDKGHYRVLDLSVDNPMSSARASYFHNSIGGYSSAKPGRYQELLSFYRGDSLYRVILNMLNTKYFIVKNNGNIMAKKNPAAFGNVWFVNQVKFVNSVNAEMLAMNKVNLQTTAVVNTEFKDLVPKTHFKSSPEDQITLTHFQPNKLVYQYTLAHNRLAVFSENYYPYGWQIHIDGKPVDMARADYTLRAVYLPAGSHTITFKFYPDVLKIGGIVNTIIGLLMAVLVIGGIVFIVLKKKKQYSNHAD